MTRSWQCLGSVLLVGLISACSRGAGNHVTMPSLPPVEPAWTNERVAEAVQARLNAQTEERIQRVIGRARVDMNWVIEHSQNANRVAEEAKLKQDEAALRETDMIVRVEVIKFSGSRFLAYAFTAEDDPDARSTILEYDITVVDDGKDILIEQRPLPFR